MKWFVLVGLAVSFVACGKARVEYDCECSASCDGATVAVEQTICASEDEAAVAIDDAVEACGADPDLNDSCDSIDCSCECVPTTVGCD